MKTYAMIYRFADEQAAAEFRESTVGTFQNIREKDAEGFHYIGFSAGEEPEVEDKLSGIIPNVGHKGAINDSDYVGVYFSAEHDESEIKRQMAFGRDEYIENDVTPNYRPKHISLITDLLDFDPVRNRPS